MSALPSTGFLRLKSIIGDPKAGIPAIIPVSRAGWYRGISAGKYPKPTRAFGPHISAWPVQAILDLVEHSMPGAANDDQGGNPTPAHGKRGRRHGHV